MSKRVKLDKSELIDLILEEVEKELTDEATSLGQEDPKYKKFPSTVFYADVADEYRAILPVVEKLLEANPQDRPYVADALEMMMFNVREGLHGPDDGDEARVDEDYRAGGRQRYKPMSRPGSPAPRSREQNLKSAMIQFLKGFEEHGEDPGWKGMLKNYLSIFRGIADVRSAITDIMKDPSPAYKINPNDAPALMMKAVEYLPSDDELEEASAGDEDPVIQNYNDKINDPATSEFTKQRLKADLAKYMQTKTPLSRREREHHAAIAAKVEKAKAAKPSLMQRAKDAFSKE